MYIILVYNIVSSVNRNRDNAAERDNAGGFLFYSVLGYDYHIREA